MPASEWRHLTAAVRHFRARPLLGKRIVRESNYDNYPTKTLDGPLRCNSSCGGDGRDNCCLGLYPDNRIREWQAPDRWGTRAGNAKTNRRKGHRKRAEREVIFSQGGSRWTVPDSGAGGQLLR
jgi:hypothetical protein